MTGRGEHDDERARARGRTPLHRITAPLATDPVGPLLVGTGLWLVALVVLLAVGPRLPDDAGWWPSTAVAGVVAGLPALAWAIARRRRGQLSGDRVDAGGDELDGSEPSSEPSSGSPGSGSVSRS
ncbi:DUF2530 domain-containing protein [Aquipuribacter nitratireducens]|uniref:DUF2530 domain-containing protein n=1 Tax=Aquipuribacter nitratireducens TaxID=650104 RepID=A0ABW0GNP2_9MICO